MKKLLLIITILFIGCTEPTHHTKNSGIVIGSSIGGNTIEEVTIEGCQYFIYDGGDQFGITHKGNCKNPIHHYEEI